MNGTSPLRRRCCYFGCVFLQKQKRTRDVDESASSTTQAAGELAAFLNIMETVTKRIELYRQALKNFSL